MTGTLVFPSSVTAALTYAREAAARGEQVVGASSLAGDENAGAFTAWERLPSIHDAGFAEAIVALVGRHGLTHVYAPLTTVHAALSGLIADGRLALTLVRPNPITEQNAALRRALDRGAVLHGFMAEIAEDAARLPSRTQTAAVLRYAESLYGESADVKLAAMLAVAAEAPQGDVVEIGTLMGKSASVLVQAARMFQIGAVLTVDPWMPVHALQQDSPSLVREVVDLWDFDLLSTGYVLNIAPLSDGRVNHLRLPSEEGFAVYDRDRRVETPDLGRTDYAGGIALLHIDGNHDLEAVRQDWALWGSRMVPGGWVIFDDYTWLHGAGPRRVGDAFLDESGAWDRAFVCGGALFVQLASDRAV